MADLGSQGKAIAAPVVGANEGGVPVDTGKKDKNTEGYVCEPVGLRPLGPGNNVKPR